MPVLTQSTNLAPSGGIFRRLPSEINANPFVGSLLSRAVSGFVRELVAGEPFAGICRSPIPTAEAATANGSRTIEAVTGIFVITATVSGATIASAATGRRVYAIDDGTLTLVAMGNTLIGEIIGMDGSQAVILCRTADVRAAGIGQGGVVTHPATGAIALNATHLDKLNVLPSTGAQAVTLPPASECGGRTITFKKTTAAAVAATLTRAGSDTIDGGTTNAEIDANNDTLTLISDGGTGWFIIARQIA